MNMNAVDMLLLFDTTFQSFVPPNIHVWIDNLADVMISNTGQIIVFNVP